MGKDDWELLKALQTAEKGVSVGGAAVSTKHAGFIVNTGCATASDVQKLIIIIKQKVLECFNVELKEEIILID